MKLSVLVCCNLSSLLVTSTELLMTPKHFTLSVPLQYCLHVAARQGDLNALKSHVERGADINTKDDNGVSTYKGNLMKL